jgi:hypothetical protein
MMMVDLAVVATGVAEIAETMDVIVAMVVADATQTHLAINATNAVVAAISNVIARKAIAATDVKVLDTLHVTARSKGLMSPNATIVESQDIWPVIVQTVVHPMDHPSLATHAARQGISQETALAKEETETRNEFRYCCL